jgi:hypothetical protein
MAFYLCTKKARHNIKCSRELSAALFFCKCSSRCSRTVKTVGELVRRFVGLYYRSQELILRSNPNNTDRVVELEASEDLVFKALCLKKGKKESLN